MTDQEKIAELKAALKVASEALSIASDWNVSEVQVSVPASWNLEASEDGMYSTYGLSQKLKQLSK